MGGGLLQKKFIDRSETFPVISRKAPYQLTNHYNYRQDMIIMPTFIDEPEIADGLFISGRVTSSPHPPTWHFLGNTVLFKVSEPFETPEERNIGVTIMKC